MAREAIFSILGSKTQGARVLDLLAGSGALGFEAVSRGADFALLCDSASSAIRSLNTNLHKIPLSCQERVKILKAAFPKETASLTRFAPFDLVFLDPPYKDREIAENFLLRAQNYNLLSPGALAIWEQEREDLHSIDPEKLKSWKLIDSRAWGRTGAAFFELE
jgi:16S rRNA (guanine966-N2)-methyltransferase